MYGCRQLRHIFSKWTLLIVVCTTAIICLYRPMVSNNGQNYTLAGPETKPTARNKSPLKHLTLGMGEPEIKPNVQIKHYDVLLSSYMRSGSTLTGIILGFRKDTFYLYEPLWKISQWAYLHGNNTVCSSNSVDCRNVEPGKAVQDKSFPSNKYNTPPGSLVMAKEILENVYDCQFKDDFERTVFAWEVTVAPGENSFLYRNDAKSELAPRSDVTSIQIRKIWLLGPSWSQVATCRKSKGGPKSCIALNIPSKCKNATHRVTKVLRLTTDLLADILHARENLKVIHLFRDPRAIINSRIHTWYPTHTDDKIVQNAKSLCNKMLYDFREGQKLFKLYPDRFKFIYYEDLTEKPLDKSKELYKYLGMDLDESKYAKVRNLPVFNNATHKTDRVKNTAFWWRMSLKWEIVQKMESVCKDVYSELGYKSLTNEEEYRNMSISNVDIPKKYLIL